MFRSPFATIIRPILTDRAPSCSILEDGTCLTCYKLYRSHPVVLSIQLVKHSFTSYTTINITIVILIVVYDNTTGWLR